MRISGRTFPVEIEYAPLSTDAEKLNQPETMAEAVVSAAKRIRERDSELKQHTGDVLVFLATERRFGISRRPYVERVFRILRFCRCTRASDSQSRHGYSQPTGAQDCAFYECGRNLNHCSRYQLCDRHRASANQSLQYPEQIQRLPIERISRRAPIKEKVAAAGLLRASVSGCILKRILKAAMSLLIRKLCERIWHRSF